MYSMYSCVVYPLYLFANSKQQTANGSLLQKFNNDWDDDCNHRHV